MRAVVRESRRRSQPGRDHDGVHDRAQVGTTIHRRQKDVFTAGFPASAFVEARKLRTPGALLRKFRQSPSWMKRKARWDNYLKNNSSIQC